MAIDMVSGYSTSSPTQLTQLCLHFLGVPPYVNCQAMYRLKHGLSAILAIMSHYRPVWHERSHALTQGGAGQHHVRAIFADSAILCTTFCHSLSFARSLRQRKFFGSL